MRMQSAAAALASLLATACIPVPANVSTLSETHGVLTSGGAPVARALVWQTEHRGHDACSQPKDAIETDAEGQFLLPGRSRFGVVFIIPGVITDYGADRTICARPLAGRAWSWRGSAFPPPPAGAPSQIACAFTINSLVCEEPPIAE